MFEVWSSIQGYKQHKPHINESFDVGSSFDQLNAAFYNTVFSV